MMEGNQFERKTSLARHRQQSSTANTSQTSPSTEWGTLAAMHCMPHNPSIIAIGVLTYVVVVEAQLRENEKKKFLIKESHTKQSHMKNLKRSRWPCDLRRRSIASLLLESRVWILLRALMFNYLVFGVGYIGCGLCNELITRSDSYRKCV